MDLDEIIKDLEHTVEYFNEPKTQVQVGRLYQAKKTLAQLLLYGVGNHVFCPHCGDKRQLKVETDLNSGRVCKSRLCKCK